MKQFELATLLNYDDDAIIVEIRRAVESLPAGPVTRRAFDQVSRVSSCTVARRFGGWQEALERAGFGDRYFGRRVTTKMRTQSWRTLDDDELIGELRRVANALKIDTLTMTECH